MANPINWCLETLHLIRTHPTFQLPTGPGNYAWNGFILGIGFGLGLGITIFSSSMYDLGLFLISLTFFHFSEFVFVAVTDPKELSEDSFLINHSREMTLARIAAFIEYFVEWYFLNWLKGGALFWLGFFITFFGQGVRLVALFTARSNFTHQISYKKKDDHELVTTGIYSIWRHPGYFGWFWWAVGSQILLGNPICIAAYFYASYQFFADRIPEEERLLVEFFGDRYVQYRKSTPTLIPFIP